MGLAAVAAAAAFAGLARPIDAGIALTSQFIDVVLEGLKPGRSYNIRELRGIPYTVKNAGTAPMEVQVEPVAPSSGSTPSPYEPVPDPNWLSLTPARFRLSPGEPGFADLTINIPDDPSLIGKHYMGQIWAHTTGRSFLAVGVTSNVRFSIGKGPETLAEESRQKQMVDLNYDLWPAALHVLKAKVGGYDAKVEEKKSFKLTNRAEKELVVVLKATPWRESLVPLPAGYTKTEDLSWVRFEPATVTVDPESLQEVRVALDVPESLRGKKTAFLVQLTLPIGTIISEAHRVYVTVAP